MLAACAERCAAGRCELLAPVSTCCASVVRKVLGVIAPFGLAVDEGLAGIAVRIPPWVALAPVNPENIVALLVIARVGCHRSASRTETPGNEAPEQTPDGEDCEDGCGPQDACAGT